MAKDLRKKVFYVFMDTCQEGALHDFTCHCYCQCICCAMICEISEISGILTVEGGRRASGATELLPIQHRHARLARPPAWVVRRGYSSIHATAAAAAATTAAATTSTPTASPSHPLFRLQGLTPLLAEPLLIPKEAHQLPCLFSHIGPLVPAVSVHVLEVT